MILKVIFANSVDPDQTADQGPHCLPVIKNRFEKFARIFSRRHKQTKFSDAGFLSVLRINLYHSLGIFSRRQIDDIFLIFLRKQDMTFHANCLLRRQFAWNVISCFLRKIRKIFQNVVCWKFFVFVLCMAPWAAGGVFVTICLFVMVFAWESRLGFPLVFGSLYSMIVTFFYTIIMTTIIQTCLCVHCSYWTWFISACI